MDKCWESRPSSVIVLHISGVEKGTLNPRTDHTWSNERNVIDILMIRGIPGVDR